MARIDGSVSASVLTMVLVGAFSGALAGLVLASALANQVWVAIVAAFVAVAIALLVRRVVFGSPSQLFIPRQLELWTASVLPVFETSNTARDIVFSTSPLPRISHEKGRT